jgi:hypothetical protein
VQNEKAVVLSVIQKRESESLPRKGKKHRPITKRRYIWVFHINAYPRNMAD